MPTLEEALNQVNYWKQALERARKDHSVVVTALNAQIAALTRKLNEAHELASKWEENYRHVASNHGMDT